MSLGDFPGWFVISACFNIASVSTRTFLKPSRETYLPKYDFYHNISKMNECLRHISTQYSGFVDVEMQYRSRLGLPQYVVHLTNFSRDNEKSTDAKSRILLSYGEHAAEFFPVQSVFYLLDNITRGFDLSPRTYEGRFTRFVLNNFDLYLVAILNPDGRVLIERTNDHCWLGTVNNVDLNADLGDEKSTRIMAEPECRVIRSLISQEHFDAFISFHSGRRKIFFPLLEEEGEFSQLSDVRHLASIMSKSVLPQYSVVPLKTFPSGGSIFAYAANERKVSFTYKISMWKNKEKRQTNSNEDCFSSLNPQSENLQAELETVHTLYSTLFNYMHYWKQLQLYEEARQLEDGKVNRLFINTVLLYIFACICVYFICKLYFPLSWRVLRSLRASFLHYLTFL